jgi:hypothetical protein
LTIPADSPDGVELALGVARSLWAAQREWSRRITDAAIKDFLDLKNESWLDEGESEPTQEEFAERMAVEAISIRADGSFEFWHDDGDLFWGHSIMVSGNLRDGPTDAGIHG